jgi:hypothetical protein
VVLSLVVVSLRIDDFTYVVPYEIVGREHSTFTCFIAMQIYKELIILLSVEKPRKFITAKFSFHKPGSSSVLIILLITYY